MVTCISLLGHIFWHHRLSFSLLQGRIIKKAFGKLRLEHVVIGKGQFQQDAAKPNVLDVNISVQPSVETVYPVVEHQKFEHQ